MYIQLLSLPILTLIRAKFAIVYEWLIYHNRTKSNLESLTSLARARCIFYQAIKSLSHMLRISISAMNALTRLAEAKTKRAQIRTVATRLKTFIENFDPNQESRYEIKEHKKKLEDLWSLFDTVQSRIEILENVDPANVDKDVFRK